MILLKRVSWKILHEIQKIKYLLKGQWWELVLQVLSWGLLLIALFSFHFSFVPMPPTIMKKPSQLHLFQSSSGNLPICFRDEQREMRWANTYFRTEIF